jgi:acetyl esterase/lipase
LARKRVTEAGRAFGARTLAIAYRLAPENPFPAALDDAVSAWRFLSKSDVAAQKVVGGGDSAGGGLTGFGITAIFTRCWRRTSCLRVAR